MRDSRTPPPPRTSSSQRNSSAPSGANEVLVPASPLVPPPPGSTAFQGRADLPPTPAPGAPSRGGARRSSAGTPRPDSSRSAAPRGSAPRGVVPGAPSSSRNVPSRGLVVPGDPTAASSRPASARPQPSRLATTRPATARPTGSRPTASRPSASNPTASTPTASRGASPSASRNTDPVQRTSSTARPSTRPTATRATSPSLASQPESTRRSVPSQRLGIPGVRPSTDPLARKSAPPVRTGSEGTLASARPPVRTPKSPASSASLRAGGDPVIRKVVPDEPVVPTLPVGLHGRFEVSGEPRVSSSTDIPSAPAVAQAPDVRVAPEAIKPSRKTTPGLGEDIVIIPDAPSIPGMRRRPVLPKNNYNLDADENPYDATRRNIERYSFDTYSESTVEYDPAMSNAFGSQFDSGLASEYETIEDYDDKEDDEEGYVYGFNFGLEDNEEKPKRKHSVFMPRQEDDAPESNAAFNESESEEQPQDKAAETDEPEDSTPIGSDLAQPGKTLPRPVFKSKLSLADTSEGFDDTSSYSKYDTVGKSDAPEDLLDFTTPSKTAASTNIFADENLGLSPGFTSSEGTDLLGVVDPTEKGSTDLFGEEPSDVQPSSNAEESETPSPEEALKDLDSEYDVHHRPDVFQASGFADDYPDDIVLEPERNLDETLATLEDNPDSQLFVNDLPVPAPSAHYFSSPDGTEMFGTEESLDSYADLDCEFDEFGQPIEGTHRKPDAKQAASTDSETAVEEPELAAPSRKLEPTVESEPPVSPADDYEEVSLDMPAPSFKPKPRKKKKSKSSSAPTWYGDEGFIDDGFTAGVPSFDDSETTSFDDDSDQDDEAFDFEKILARVRKPAKALPSSRFFLPPLDNFDHSFKPSANSDSALGRFKGTSQQPIVTSSHQNTRSSAAASKASGEDYLWLSIEDVPSLDRQSYDRALQESDFASFESSTYAPALEASPETPVIESHKNDKTEPFVSRPLFSDEEAEAARLISDDSRQFSIDDIDSSSSPLVEMFQDDDISQYGVDDFSGMDESFGLDDVSGKPIKFSQTPEVDRERFAVHVPDGNYSENPYEADARAYEEKNHLELSEDANFADDAYNYCELEYDASTLFGDDTSDLPDYVDDGQDDGEYEEDSQANQSNQPPVNQLIPLDDSENPSIFVGSFQPRVPNNYGRSSYDDDLADETLTRSSLRDTTSEVKKNSSEGVDTFAAASQVEDASQDSVLQDNDLGLITPEQIETKTVEYEANSKLNDASLEETSDVNFGPINTEAISNLAFNSNELILERQQEEHASHPNVTIPQTNRRDLRSSQEDMTRKARELAEIKRQDQLCEIEDAQRLTQQEEGDAAAPVVSKSARNRTLYIFIAILTIIAVFFLVLIANQFYESPDSAPSDPVVEITRIAVETDKPKVASDEPEPSVSPIATATPPMPEQQPVAVPPPNAVSALPSTAPLDEDSVKPPALPEPLAQPIVPTGTIQFGTKVMDSTKLKDVALVPLLGTNVAGDRMLIQSVVNGIGAWVGANQDNQIFLRFPENTNSAAANIVNGNTISFIGVLQDSLDPDTLTQEQGRSRFVNQGAYVDITSFTVSSK